MESAARNRLSAHPATVVSQPSELENMATRLFRAPPERVFRLFTDPATAAVVFSPNPSDVTIEKMDFRKGGHYSIHVRLPDGSTVRFFGEYLEVDPPRRVVNTFEVSSQPGVVATETDEFEPVGGFTRVTVHWKYPTRQARDQMYGPEMETAVATMWENAARMVEDRE